MKFVASLILALALFGATAYGQELSECLEQDSISCVQRSIYKKARAFFDRDSFELVSGVSLVKVQGRSARSGDKAAAEQAVESADDIMTRQNAIEGYVGTEAVNFLSGRSLKVNFAPMVEKIGSTARSLTSSVPAEIQAVADDIAEGRSKKKHLMKKLMPLIMLAKVKFGVLATLGYFALALIAKKALLVSFVSLVLSAIVGLKGLFSKGSQGHHDTTGYNNAWAGSQSAASWSAPAPAASWSGAAAPHSWDESASAAAQAQAYSGYQH
ncbi:uncharacterized protein LOC106649082 [Trichogramma pretiosum]|uniref:uncharacterized protein LOC106649082 n=1 Tax=Trichogramma pretiosum TaxID=7493 RepID=UPI0006C9CCED|nr:uncharacterized protein LOC106649082 [Trichogramma pretiosum]